MYNWHVICIYANSEHVHNLSFNCSCRLLVKWHVVFPIWCCGFEAPTSKKLHRVPENLQVFNAITAVWCWESSILRPPWWQPWPKVLERLPQSKASPERWAAKPCHGQMQHIWIMNWIMAYIYIYTYFIFNIHMWVTVCHGQNGWRPL